jgi:hypothetical protein
MRSLHRPVSVKTVATELAEHILDLVVWSDGSREALMCREVFFFFEKGNENHGLGAGFAVHKRI